MQSANYAVQTLNDFALKVLHFAKFPDLSSAPLDGFSVLFSCRLNSSTSSSEEEIEMAKATGSKMVVLKRDGR